MADALDLVIRLPQLWRRVEALEVKASYARFVARRTRDLTVDQASYVDERVAEPADGRIPWSRFEDLVTGLVAASDPETAARREQEVAERHVARPTRSTQDGMRGFFIRGPFHVVALLDARIQWIADILAELGDLDDLEAFVQWRDRPACPVEDVEDQLADERTGDRPELDWAEVLPAVTLHVHTYVGHEATGVVRVEGHGPVTDAWVREHLGPRARVTIKPVLDIAGQAPVDAYEIPDRHRQAVQFMTPADTFPWGVSSARTLQIDHTEAYRHGGPRGQSRVGNYGPMTRSTTGSRPTVGGRCGNRSQASTSGATRTARPTSSTTPAPGA